MDAGGRGSITLFVSNLPPKATEVALKGRLAQVLGCSIVIVKLEQRVNTFANVKFSSPTHAQHALTFDRMNFQGKKIFLSPFIKRPRASAHRARMNKPKKKLRLTTNRTKSGGEGSKKLFVSNLPPTATKLELEERLVECIRDSVKVMRLVKRVMYTFACVNLPSQADVDRAITLDQTIEFLGRKMYFSRYHVKPRHRVIEPRESTPSANGEGAVLQQ